MDSDQFAKLRRKAGRTQQDVAEALGVTSRTVALWESASPEKQFNRLESRAIHQLFLPMVLTEPVRRMAELAGTTIPCEFAAIWLVYQREEMIQLPSTSFCYQEPNQKFDTPRLPWLTAPMVEVSLTTWSLRTSKTINLAGDNIAACPMKKWKNTRNAFYLRSGVCESLLHVPEFEPSPSGPYPILMLSLQNRLGADYQVLKFTKQEVEGRTAFTPEDERTAKTLAERFRMELVEDMRLLDMIVDET